jgi:hypothetical protein
LSEDKTSCTTSFINLHGYNKPNLGKEHNHTISKKENKLDPSEVIGKIVRINPKSINDETEIRKNHVAFDLKRGHYGMMHRF